MSLFFPVDRRQAGILSDRYLDVLLGDWRAVLLLLLQAPLIGALVAGVWSNIHGDSLTLYFVLCLSAFFLGAVNSAREIVKERAIFVRERMFNLSTGAYVVSKYRIQAILMVIQCTILAGIVRAYIPLEVNVLWVGLALVLTALAGTAVGLLISAWMGTPDQAVMMVPLVVIPQILFSDLVLGEGQLKNWTGVLEQMMPVHWSYEFLKELRHEPALWTSLGSAAILIAIIYGCFLLTVLILSRAKS